MSLDNSEIFVADTVLKAAQELQRTIIESHPEASPEVAQYALDVLGDVRETFGGINNVALRTASAFIVNRGLTLEEQLYDVIQFGEMDLTGWFGGIQYIKVGRALNSLCLDLFDVKVLRPEKPDDPAEGRLDMPLLVPVFSVNNIWALN